MMEEYISGYNQALYDLLLLEKIDVDLYYKLLK